MLSRTIFRSIKRAATPYRSSLRHRFVPVASKALVSNGVVNQWSTRLFSTSDDGDSHDDFKPKRKIADPTESDNDIMKVIDNVRK